MLRVSTILDKTKGKTYQMPLEDAIKEHEKLVRVFKHPTPEEDSAELADQGGELKGMLRKKWFGKD